MAPTSASQEAPSIAEPFYAIPFDPLAIVLLALIAGTLSSILMLLTRNVDGKNEDAADTTISEARAGQKSDMKKPVDNALQPERIEVDIEACFFLVDEDEDADEEGRDGRRCMNEQTELLPRKYNTWPVAEAEQRIAKGEGKGKKRAKRQSLTMLWHGVNQLNTGYGWMA